MKKLLIIALIFCVCELSMAQCNNENDWIEWSYTNIKMLENYAVDYVSQSISAKEEMKIGDTLHIGMKKENDLDENFPKQEYLNFLVNKLVKYNNRQGIDYKIHVINDKRNLNAFSVAGGHLYITAKMVEWVESEDELAFIIAHEIAHVDAKHSLRKVQKMVAVKTYGEKYFGNYTEIAANLQNLLSQPFGQIDEYEADRLGALIVTKAGYNPRKGLRFFERMGSKEAYNPLEKIMRTHPYSSERLKCLDSYLTNDLKK